MLIRLSNTWATVQYLIWQSQHWRAIWPEGCPTWRAALRKALKEHRDLHHYDDQGRIFWLPFNQEAARGKNWVGPGF